MSETTESKTLTVKLRISPELRNKIAASATKYNRSMNADMVARLEQSFKGMDFQVTRDELAHFTTESLLVELMERFANNGYILTLEKK